MTEVQLVIGAILSLHHVYSSASLCTNPKYICLKASPIDFNGNYFQVSLHPRVFNMGEKRAPAEEIDIVTTGVPLILLSTYSLPYLIEVLC